MLIAGLDLAAQPDGSALAVLEWSPTSAKLAQLQLCVNDQDVLQVAPTLHKLGIDCALGWPVEFVDFVSQYSNSSLEGLSFDGGLNRLSDLPELRLRAASVLAGLEAGTI